MTSDCGDLGLEISPISADIFSEGGEWVDKALERKREEVRRDEDEEVKRRKETKSYFFFVSSWTTFKLLEQRVEKKSFVHNTQQRWLISSVTHAVPPLGAFVCSPRQSYCRRRLYIQRGREMTSCFLTDRNIDLERTIDRH